MKTKMAVIQQKDQIATYLTTTLCEVILPLLEIIVRMKIKISKKYRMHKQEKMRKTIRSSSKRCKSASVQQRKTRERRATVLTMSIMTKEITNQLHFSYKAKLMIIWEHPYQIWLISDQKTPIKKMVTMSLKDVIALHQMKSSIYHHYQIWMTIRI